MALTRSDHNSVTVGVSSCVQPVSDHFLAKFQHHLDAFKAARLLWPHKVNNLSTDAGAVDSIKYFPFF